MKYVVTGGGGFLGKAICFKLRDQGHEVVSISRNRYPELENRGITCVKANIFENKEVLLGAVRGAEAVFHVAAMVEMWGRYEEFFRVNVIGTRNVIDACKESGVKKLIYTSSPSVVADGTDLCGIDESYPYPKRYEAHYPATKAIAEREVLSQNSDDLYTVSLRPHLIWGPGDTNLVPQILERGRAGKLVRIGKGDNMVDLSYVEDCVGAHLCALSALDRNPRARGKAFFISQGEPVSLWSWIDEVLVRSNVDPIRKSLSFGVAHGLATVLEFVAKIRPGSHEPLFTKFLVTEMATSHYFNIGAAKKELGYEPQFSIPEAMDLMFNASGLARGNSLNSCSL